MTCQNLFSEHLLIDFCVDFGGGNLLVSEHHLNGSEVGSSLKQMGGKGMTEGVRADLFRNTCFGTVAFHDIEHHDAAQLASKAVEEHVILESVLDIEFITEGEAVVNLTERRFGYGHDALLASFAKDRDISLLFIDVGEPQLNQLRHAQPTRIESLEDCPVALSIASRRISCRNNPIDLIDRKHYRQMFSKFWGFNQLCRVIGRARRTCRTIVPRQGCAFANLPQYQDPRAQI